MKSSLKQPSPKAARSSFFSFLRCCPSRRVRFHHTVKVAEYSRHLGGSDGVPSDGSHISLGLGQLLRMRAEPLAPRNKPRTDQIPWMESKDRAIVLKVAMGKAKYRQAWSQQRPAMRRLQRRRRLTAKEGKDALPMPESSAEARSRALQVANEVEEERIALKKERTMRELFKTQVSCVAHTLERKLSSTNKCNMCGCIGTQLSCSRCTYHVCKTHGKESKALRHRRLHWKAEELKRFRG